MWSLYANPKVTAYYIAISMQYVWCAPYYSVHVLSNGLDANCNSDRNCNRK